MMELMCVLFRSGCHGCGLLVVLGWLVVPAVRSHASVLLCCGLGCGGIVAAAALLIFRAPLHALPCRLLHS